MPCWRDPGKNAIQKTDATIVFTDACQRACHVQDCHKKEGEYMDKKSILAVKKLLKPKEEVIDRLYTCYYDGSGEVFMMQTTSNLMSLTDESLELYLQILQKTLTGKLGRCLYNLPFPLEAENEGGPQDVLFTLLKDPSEDNIEFFFNRVIETYQFSGRTLVILAHGTYDVPYKAKDGVVLEDSSDTVYEFYICSFCPVSKVMEGLEYDSDKVVFTDRGSYVAARPEAGFLFPEFNDRTADIHAALYFAKKPDDLHPELITDLLGCELPETEDVQKEAFRKLVAHGLGDKCTVKNISGVFDSVKDFAEEYREDDVPTELGILQLENVLRENGADSDSLKGFDEAYEEAVGKGGCFTVDNITERGKVVVKAPGFTVNVASGYADMIKTRKENGMEYLVLPLTDATLNGVPVC